MDTSTLLHVLDYLYLQYFHLTWVEKAAFWFSAATYVPYIWSTLYSNARPTISTWLSWFIMDIAILAAMFAQKAVAVQMVAYAIGCGFVIVACLARRANLGWTLTDTVCMALVLVAMGIWAASGNPDFAIIMSLAAVIFSCVPMVKNLVDDPTREPLLPWVLVTIGGAFGVAAIKSLTVADAATQVVFFAAQVLFLVLTLRKLHPSRWSKLAIQVLMRD